MSLTALREIFKDFASSVLPPDLAEYLGGNKAAIKANHNAYRQWKLRDNERRIATHFANCDTTPATNNPVPHSVPASAPTTSLNPCIIPPTILNQPSLSPLLTHGPTHARPHVPPPTVHRTDRRLTTVHRTTCPDLSLHLCPHSPPPAAVGQHAIAWDSHVLFPEISAPTSHPAVLPTTSFPPRGTTPQATPIPTQPPSTTLHATPNTTNPPRRTARVRTTKSTPQDPSLVDLKARDFYDIPLQYAEGRELLELIGAASIQIPPHLLQPTPTATVQPQAYLSTLGQSSRPTTQAHPDKQLLTKNKKPKATRATSFSTSTPLKKTRLTPRTHNLTALTWR